MVKDASSKDGSDRDGVKLGDHYFKRVKSGLDEEQVVSFVNELTSERDTLIKRQEHLASLSVLAERTVAEADNVARQVKEEAFDQAKAEANAIVAKAEEQGQQIIEEKRAEAVDIAEKEAEAIKVDARKQAESLLEEKTRRVQSELRDASQRLFRELLSQLESLKQQVTELEVNFGRTLTLSQPAKPDNPAVVEEGNSLNSGTTAQVIPEARGGILSEALEADINKLENRVSVAIEDKETTEYEGEVELTILPPTDIKQIMGIMIYLESLPEVETTELVPLTDRSLIMVFLREPMQLVEILKTLPEVGQAKEVTDGEVTGILGAARDGDKRRKIEMKLSGNSVSGGIKERINSEVPRNVSS
jgi:cell division septum initiation protein DivIVA